MKLLARLGLLLATLLVTLGVLEGAFRALDLRGFYAERERDWEGAFLPRSEALPGVKFQLRPGGEFEIAYESDPRGYFGESNGITYRLNRYGLRGPDFPTAKPAGRFRIALLGDSFTFGEGVKFEDTLGEQLASILTGEVSPNIEVLNLGVSVWDTSDEIHFLEQVGVTFQPDLVVVVYVLNDAGYGVGLDFWKNFRDAYKTSDTLQASYFLSWVYARVGRAAQGRRYIDRMVASAREHRAEWQASFALLSRGRNVAAGAGAEFAVAIYPFLFQLDDDHPFEPLHAGVREYCERAGIPVLDLLEAFRGQSYADLWVHPSDQHPNEVGHAIAARSLANFLIAHGLLRDAPSGP